MHPSVRTTKVLALPAGLPVVLVDEILTAAEAALERYGAARIRLDTTEPGLVVVADLPEVDTASPLPVEGVEQTT